MKGADLVVGSRWIHKRCEGPCAFCGKPVIMRTADLSVQHARPTCTKFDELDALSFVIAHRRALGLPAPKEDRQ
jgi:hypothetical protein